MLSDAAVLRTAPRLPPANGGAGPPHRDKARQHQARLQPHGQHGKSRHSRYCSSLGSSGFSNYTTISHYGYIIQLPILHSLNIRYATRKLYYTVVCVRLLRHVFGTRFNMCVKYVNIRVFHSRPGAPPLATAAESSRRPCCCLPSCLCPCSLRTVLTLPSSSCLVATSLLNASLVATKLSLLYPQHYTLWRRLVRAVSVQFSRI